MLFNYLMGMGGFLLAGDSLGRAFRGDKILLEVAILGAAEFLCGVYFSTAAIGIATTAGINLQHFVDF